MSDKKVSKYTIFKGHTAASLNALIGALINQGWEPLEGGFSVVPITLYHRHEVTQTKIRFFQVMIKYE